MKIRVTFTTDQAGMTNDKTIILEIPKGVTIWHYGEHKLMFEYAVKQISELCNLDPKNIYIWNITVE